MKSSGGDGGGRRGKGGVDVVERNLVVVGDRALVLASGDPVPHIDEPRAAVDEDRLAEGPSRIDQQRRCLGRRQHEAGRPAAYVGDAREVSVDDLVERALPERTIVRRRSCLSPCARA